MLSTHEDLNQALEFDAKLYQKSAKAQCLTNFQWKKEFKRVAASMAKDCGWNEQSAKQIAKSTMKHYMDEWKARDFAMHRKEWRIYSPESSAKEFMDDYDC